ncbi:GNAT family N-acetyltransferase [Ferrimonas senticii]|uniref:GNAT family N-acetyltransferase n=1 Tax=Ferrimonas senticii TaxID=394566 RepID=UPI0004045E2D|nr:GNAT family N-acetyltransferase [Ferrimonas senticii]
MIQLVDVTKDNYLDCLKLELAEDQQENVASNAATIAQSKFESHYRLRAITCDLKVVGMLAFCFEEQQYWLFRLMIDKSWQGQGIAAKAIGLLLVELGKEGAPALQTMHKPSNVAAAKLYQRLGFVAVGVMDDGDIQLELRLNGLQAT